MKQVLQVCLPFSLHIGFVLPQMICGLTKLLAVVSVFTK